MWCPGPWLRHGAAGRVVVLLLPVTAGGSDPGPAANKAEAAASFRASLTALPSAAEERTVLGLPCVDSHAGNGGWQ